jgi:hypothetical protein
VARDTAIIDDGLARAQPAKFRSHRSKVRGCIVRSFPGEIGGTVKVDRYTKTVLTIIAIALVWLCLRDVLPVPLHARAGEQAVTITGIDAMNPLAVKIVAIERQQWAKKIDAFRSVQEFGPWDSIRVIQ